MTTKKAALSKMTGSGINRLNSEISKCELVCANCHRNESFLSKDLVPIFKNRKERQEFIDIPTKPEDATKTCELCGKMKSEVNFTKLKTGRLHTYCKSCLRIQNRKYAAKENRKRSSKEYIIAQKDNKPCTDCGEIFRYWMLDFDHVHGDKTKNVSILQNRALKQIKEEIEKCELVCVNCHRIRTHNKRNAIENKQEKIDQIDLQKIDLQKIRVITLNKIETAKQILEKYHYAGFGRPASNVFEAVYGEEIVAIVKFAPVVRKEVATKENYDHIQVLELDRFCIIPKFQIKNAASKILSLIVPLIKKERPDVKLLVSFADMAQGHNGTIYKASNWRFVGTCADSYVYERDDGTRINKKTLYDTAKRNGLKEKEYAASLGLSKVITPGKHKFIYEL
jgi:ribosome-binding protein aMBF1 (putative translation factor)